MGIEGAWQGEVDVWGVRARLWLTVTQDASGAYAAVLEARDLALGTEPVADVEVSDGVLTGTVAAMQSTLEARVDGDGVRARIRGRYGDIDVALVRDESESGRIGVPSGRWDEPEDAGDGWEPAQGTIDPDPIDALIENVRDGTYPLVDSVVVVHEGRLVCDAYFSGRTATRTHTFQSCTKSVMSLLVGVAVELGAIDSIDRPMWTYFADYEASRWVAGRYGATVQDALAMRTGLVWNETLPYTDGENDNTKMNRSEDWIGYVLDRELRQPAKPGWFEYQSGNSILLGEVLRRTTGRGVDELAREWLFGPLGIDDFAWWRSSKGVFHTGGGLHMRPRDMAKIGELVLHGGSFRGTQVVPESWVLASTATHSRDDENEYGYQWRLQVRQYGASKFRATVASGYGGQYMHVIPELDLVVVSNASNFGGDGSQVAIVEKHVLPAILG